MLELLLIFLGVVMVYVFVFQKSLLFVALLLNGRVGYFATQRQYCFCRKSIGSHLSFYEVHTLLVPIIKWPSYSLISFFISENT